jgi:multiple sugar transport system ATP-binding protein
VVFGIRPNDIYEGRHAPERVKGGEVKAVVEVIEPLGSEIHLYVTAGRHSFIAVVDVQTQVKVHQEVALAMDLEKMHLFEKDPPNLRVQTKS